MLSRAPTSHVPPRPTSRSAWAAAAAVAALVLSLIAGADAQVRFDRVGVEDGLPQGTVYAIAQDTTGFVWFGTGGGLARWDGLSAVTYRHDPADPASLSDDFVTALLASDDGRLWVGTESGLDRFDPRTGRFERFGGAGAPAVLGGRVRHLAAGPGGRVWVGTAGSGVARLDPETGRAVRYVHDPDDPASLGSDHVESLAVVARALWVGTMAGLDRVDPESRRAGEANGRVRRVRHRPPSAAGARSDAVANALAPSRSGQLWLGTLNGVALLDPPSGQIRALAPPADTSGALASIVWGLFEDRSGVLWVLTEAGVVRYDPAEGSVARILHDAGRPTSLPADHAQAVFEDATGAIWIGTVGGGAAPHDPADARFGVIAHADDDPRALGGANVLAVASGLDGSLWVGTRDGGVSRRRPGAGAFERFRHDPGVPSSLNADLVTALLVGRGGQVWAGTAGGVARFEGGGRFTRFAHDPDDDASIADDRVISLAQTPDGAVWVGAFAGGLSRIDRAGRVRRYAHDPDDETTLPDPTVPALEAAADGSLWVGTARGVARLDVGAGTFERVGPRGDSLLVWTLHQDAAGTLWIGSDRGLTSLDAAGRTATLTTADGLPSNAVRAIESDAAGRLWVSTNAGLARYVPGAGGAEGGFQVFTGADGLPPGEFTWRASALGPDSTMYLGTTDGLVHFAPGAVAPSAYAAPVVLTGLRVMDERVHDFPGALEVLELGPEEDFFTFEFAALDYAAPERTRFQYRLVGLEDGWRETTAARPFAAYTSVPPGSYELQVRGTNADGVWSPRQARLAVRVAPPWYGTWWARLLAGVLTVGLTGAALVGVHRRRIRDVERRQLETTLALSERHLREKDTILRDVHHRVKNNLQVVASLVNLQSDAVEDEAARAALRQMRGRIEALAIVHRRLYSDDSPLAVSAPLYVRELAALLTGTLHVGEAPAVDVEVADVPLDADTAVPIGLALAELVANACQHGFAGTAGRLRVSLVHHPDEAGDRLVLAVEDSGPGLPPGLTAPPDGSLGLQLASDLALQLGGRLEMGRSAALGGARLALDVPYTVAAEVDRDGTAGPVPTLGTGPDPV